MRRIIELARWLPSDGALGKAELGMEWSGLHALLTTQTEVLHALAVAFVRANGGKRHVPALKLPRPRQVEPERRGSTLADLMAAGIDVEYVPPEE